jgi:hypothetical protein
LYGHNTTLEGLSEKVVKTLVYSTVCNITTIIWYCMFDWPEESKAPYYNNSEAYFGLFFANRTWKPGAYAYQLCARSLSNSTYNPVLIKKQSISSTNSLKTFIYRKTNGETAVIFWCDPLINNEDRLSVTIQINENTSNIVQHNIYNGSAKILTQFNLEVTAVPIFITFTTNNSNALVIFRVKDSIALNFYIIGTPIIIIFVVLLILHQNKQKNKTLQA